MQEAHRVISQMLTVDASQTTQFARRGGTVSPTWSKGSKMSHMSYGLNLGWQGPIRDYIGFLGGTY